MAPFSRENELVHTQKKSSKGELMIWRTKMQARVQGKVKPKEFGPRVLVLWTVIQFAWVSTIQFEMTTWCASTYLRRLDSPMLEQNFVNARPTITILMSSLGPKNSTLFEDQWHVQWQHEVWRYKDYVSWCLLFWGPYVKPFL